MELFHNVGISLDELLNKLGDLIQVMDPDGKIRYANTRWLDQLGYSEGDLAYLNFWDDVLHPDDHTMFAEWMDAAAQGTSTSGDVELVLKTRVAQPIIVDGCLIPRVEDGKIQSVVCVFHDVTHHREFEDELRRMFELSVDMLAIVDFDGKFVKVNPAWERVLGYSPDELIGTPYIQYVHPDDVERTQAVEATSQHEQIRNFENRYRCVDGSYRWLSWHASPYPDEGRFYCIVRDVTEHKRAQKEIDNTNERLKAIIDNSGTVISMKDRTGAFVLVNEEFARRFYNGDKDAVIGLTDKDVFNAEIAEALHENDAEVFTSGGTMQFEENLPGDEGVRTYLSTKFPMRDADGELFAVCTIATDITYRKLTETQLLLRNQAIEFSPSGISIADATLPDMPLIYINPAFEENTGYTALDAIGRNCRFLQGDDRDQPAIDEIREALAEEKSCTVVLRNYRKDGTMFFNELSLAPIHDVSGKLTHYVGISMDVTDRIRAEEKIQAQNQALREANFDLAIAQQEAQEAAEKIQRQNEALVQANRELAIARKKAEDATRLKSQFLATMSHELRTPLNAIIGYTEIQLAGMAGELGNEQRDYQERVLANADHLLALINDVLDIAKIEAGRLEIVNKPFEVREWLEDVVSQMRVLAADKGVDFQVDFDERVPDVILGDPARIRQIAINLISNAIKFTEDGYVRLSIRKHGRDAWKLIVEDTGIGIPSHMQETIFEEFRQVDGSSQRKAGGTGLGLSIVRKLALMMGGNVRLKSQVGAGSSFTIFLPLVEEVAEVPNGE